MNLKFTLTTLVFLILPFLSFSQHYEVGATAGISLYQGDLSPSTKRTKVGKINPMVGIFARYNFNRFFVLRAGANFAMISADDSKAERDAQRERNLSFRSHIIEGNLILEINILGYQPYNLERPWSPFIFGGISGLHFNPKAKYEGEWIALQPLGTEGQNLTTYPDRQRYSKVSGAFIAGGGIKYALNDTWNIGVEVGVRSSFTDYLDDVSLTYVDEGMLLEQSELAAALANRSGNPVNDGQGRGNDIVKDWYTFVGVTISKNFLDNGLVGSRKRSRRNKDGCPTF